MSEAARKKYYWLKLKEDFFRNKKIKKLRRIAGGDTYTIIYLKMLLLSLNHEGKLFFEGVEETLAEEIALEIDEEAENVQIALNYLFSNMLIEEVDEDEYMLPEAVNSMGSESSSAARMRKHRAKKKEALPAPENTGALPEPNNEVSQCDAPVTNSDTEKEKEKEKREEIETDKQTEKREEKKEEKEKQTDQQKEMTTSDKETVNLLRELFVGWLVSDYEILYISHLVNDKLPVDVDGLYGRDIRIYDALYTLTLKAKADNVESICGWLEKMIPILL